MRRFHRSILTLTAALLLFVGATRPTDAQTDAQLAVAAAKAVPSTVAVTSRYEMGEDLGLRTFQESQVTGFVVAADGLILTVKYQRAEAQHTVTLPDGRKLLAKELVLDRRNFLVLLKVDATDLTPLPVGTVEVEPGQPAVTVYSQLDRKGFVIASGTIGDYFFPRGMTAIGRQTDIPGQLLAAGSPVLNDQGQLLGVTHQLRLPKDKEVGTLLMVLGKYVEQLVAARATDDRLVELKPGMMGMRMSNEPGDDAAVVVEVVKDSPAAKAGILPGDRITTFDGRPMKRGVDVVLAGRFQKAGDTIQLEVERDGETRTVPLTLVEVPANLLTGQKPKPADTPAGNAQPSDATPPGEKKPPRKVEPPPP